MACEISEPLKLKEKGNGYFNSGDHENALICYTKAINLTSAPDDKDKAVLYKNRAAVYLKRNQYENVINDCTAALEIVPNDTKALYRRCQALESLNRYSEAFKDARLVIHIDPKNKVMESILTRLNAKIQEMVKEQNSTSNKIQQMFHYMFDSEPDNTLEKRKQAANNMIVLAREKAGADLICQSQGMSKILKLLQDNKDPEIIISCTRLLGELTKGNKDRCISLLNKAGGGLFLGLLNSNVENQVISAQSLIQVILDTIVEMNLKADKHADPKLLKEYSKEINLIMSAILSSVSMRTITALARDAILELIMRNVEYKALDWSRSLVEFKGIERIMEVAGELDDIKYESSMNISSSTRTHVAVTLSRIYDNLGGDKHRESFKDQVNQYVVDKLKGPDIEAKVRVTAAINCLLMGPIDVGNQCIGLNGVIEMMLVMAGSDDPIQQRVAAEAIISAASKKDKCTSIINQGVGILRKLYSSSDPSIKVRALVGLCKLGSFGGHDASLKPFDENAQQKLAEACRKFLINPSKDKDLKKWAAEGLSYLTLDADIKEELIDDEVAIRALIELAKTGNPSVVYGCITTLVNLTNSYYKEEVIPEMIQLAKFAKQHIPETHPMDEQKYVETRVKSLCKAGVTVGLVGLSKTESRNSKELIARVFNAMCEFQELRGKVVQQGGTKALLSLAQEGTMQGKAIAAQALARIGITIDPEVAFPGQRCSEVVRPLVSLLHPNCTGLQNFESLMALTNLAQVGESIRNRILKEKGFSRIDTYVYEDHVEIARAAIQCMVNMLLSEEVIKLFLDTKSDRVKFMVLMCGNEDDDTVAAASSCLCILSNYDSEKVSETIFQPQEWNNCMKNLLVHGNIEIQYRGVYLISKLISSSQVAAQKIIETDIMEVLMAITKVDSNNVKRCEEVKNLANSALKSAESKNLIKPSSEEVEKLK